MTERRDVQRGGRRPGTAGAPGGLRVGVTEPEQVRGVLGQPHRDPGGYRRVGRAQPAYRDLVRVRGHAGNLPVSWTDIPGSVSVIGSVTCPWPGRDLNPYHRLPGPGRS